MKVREGACEGEGWKGRAAAHPGRVEQGERHAAPTFLLHTAGQPPPQRVTLRGRSPQQLLRQPGELRACEQHVGIWIGRRRRHGGSRRLVASRAATVQSCNVRS